MTNKISKPPKPRVDKKGTKLLTTTQFADALGIHPTTARRWCDEGIVVFTRGSGGRRWISMSEVERVRNEDASTTVNNAIERIEASVVERDTELRDLINAKSGESKRNLEIVFETLGTKLNHLQKTIDRMQQSQQRSP